VTQGAPSVLARPSEVSAIAELALSIRAALRAEPFVTPDLTRVVGRWAISEGRLLATICAEAPTLPRAFLPLDAGDARDGLAEFAFVPRDRFHSDLEAAFDGPLPRHLVSGDRHLHAALTRELGSFADAHFLPRWRVLRRLVRAWGDDGPTLPGPPVIRSVFVDAPVLFGEGGGDGCALPLVPGQRRAVVADVRVPDPPVVTPLVGGDRAILLLLAGGEAVTTAQLASWTELSQAMVRYHGKALVHAGLLDCESGRPRLWRRTRLGDVIVDVTAIA